MMPSEGFPSVNRNPFGRKPLEASDRDLLVGRDQVLRELQWHLHEGNDARLLLLTGPSGSGRTSLMRVLKGSLQRSVHVVDVDSSSPAADLMGQIHHGLIGGEALSGPSQATDMLIQTLRRDHGQALIVLDLPVLDGADLPQILSKSMSYLERLDALIVVIATPEHAARLGPALEARFQEEFTLQPFNDEEIATMIDVRVRRENQQGWRPRQSWIEEHLHALPRYPRELLREMSKQYMAHQRGDARPVSRGHGAANESPVDTWEAGPGATGLELNMDDLEGAREQDAPPPIRPSLDDVVETDPKWMEDFGRSENHPGASEPASLSMPNSESVEATSAPAEPLVSQVEFGSTFGRIARRSIAATNAAASAAKAPVNKAPEAKVQDQEDQGWDFTDLTESNEEESSPLAVEHDLGQHVEGEPLRPEAHGLSMEVLQVLQQAISTASSASTTPLNGLAEALTRLGLPHLGALQHRPLRTQALRELNAGQAVVVEAASQREVSPSDVGLLKRLGVKRARLSQICNGLHRDGVLDVAQRGRSRVFTLSSGARAQLKAWNLLGGEA